MNDTVSIYSLNDPDTNEPQYVGWTAKGLDGRLLMHLRDPRSPVCRDWFKELQAQGKTPAIVLLETVSWDERYTQEKLYINRMEQAGHKLLNQVGNKRYWQDTKTHP